MHVFRLSLPGPTASVSSIIGGFVSTRLFVVLSRMHKCSWFCLLYLEVDY